MVDGKVRIWSVNVTSSFILTFKLIELVVIDQYRGKTSVHSVRMVEGKVRMRSVSTALHELLPFKLTFKLIEVI